MVQYAPFQIISAMKVHLRALKLIVPKLTEAKCVTSSSLWTGKPGRALTQAVAEIPKPGDFLCEKKAEARFKMVSSNLSAEFFTSGKVIYFDPGMFLV